MRLILALIAALLLACFASGADYGPSITSSDGQRTYVKGADGSYYLSGAGLPQTVSTAATGSDALDEVNAKRASRGLRPFVRDEGLTRSAQACAQFRAEHRLFGHTSNDFGFVPQGTRCDATGCAAYPASYGFMACCVYDNYTHAGACSVPGPDGKMYHHLCVSNGGSAASREVPAYLPASVSAPQAYSAPTCANGTCAQPVQQRGFRRW